MAVLGSLLWDVIGALVLLVVVVYLYGTANYHYFKKLGIPYVKPFPFVGNFGGILTGALSFTTSTKPLYDQLKSHRVGGIFQSRDPVLLICDPEIIKVVLTKDFASVHDHHGVVLDEKNDPLGVNLFSMPGIRWKNLRMKLSPVFTSGKLKQMLSLMNTCSEQLGIVLSKKADSGGIVELEELLMRFATDVIGSCAFGIECNSILNPKSVFYRNGQNFFKRSVFLSIYLFLSQNKMLAKILPLNKLVADNLPSSLEGFFINLMQGTIAYRKSKNAERKDLVQLLMHLQKSDEGKDRESHPQEVIFTDLVIAAQAFSFFIDALHAIAGTVGFALYHLSLDPRLQQDVVDEVLSVVSQHNCLFTYEGLKEMELLDMVVSETLRMYPPAGTLRREVTAPKYKIPDTTYTVDKGTKILVSIYGLHHDSEYFPEPERFDPYRFTENACRKRHSYSYLPFGEGPRMCLGNRFARLEVMLCLASLIKEFKFSICPKTQIPIQLQTHSPILGPMNGIHLRVEKRAIP